MQQRPAAVLASESSLSLCDCGIVLSRRVRESDSVRKKNLAQINVSVYIMANMKRRKETPLAAWLSRHRGVTIDDLAEKMAEARPATAKWFHRDRRRFFDWYATGERIPNHANQKLIEKITGEITDGADPVREIEWSSRRGGWRWSRGSRISDALAGLD